VPSVRLIDEKGEQLGILNRAEALQKARESGLDLVEVAPNSNPPVCKIMDYGKFKYQQRKKQHHQHRTQVKEIRIGFKTGEHDLEVKAKRVREFLAKKDRVLVSMRLRGREMGHVDLGVEHLREFAQRFEEIAKVERPAGRESGGRLSMVLAPKT
jgi:translation initiation factor IF-3